LYFEKSTIAFINLRYANFYSEDFISRIKEKNDLRLVAVVDIFLENKIPANIAKYMDEAYKVDSKSKNNFSSSFNYDKLQKTILLKGKRIKS